MAHEILKPYLAVVSARYRTLLQYRVAAFAGLVTQFFWGAVKVMVFAAFYAVSTIDQPMSLAAVVTYVWLGQAMLGVLPWNVDGEISNMIKTGSVSYELVRPLDLYYFWFCRTIALRTATTTLRCAPMILISMLVFPLVGLGDWALRLPDGVVSLSLFVVSMCCAVMLAVAMTMILHVVLLWTISGEGLNRIMPSFVLVFSGMIVPLPLFPDWLQPLLNNQPFRGLVDVPFRIYSGNIPMTDAVGDIIQQIIWTFLIILLGRWMLSRSMRQLVVQGG